MDSLSVMYFVAWLVLLLVLAIPGYRTLSQVSAAIRRNRQARTWPQVPGSVSDAHVETVMRRTGRRGPLGFRGVRHSYKPVIAYTYVVAGQSYQGSRYRYSWPGDWLTNKRDEAEAIVGRYLAGKGAVVRYDPADPAQACLEVAASETGLQAVRVFAWVLLAGAAVLLALGVSTVVRGGLNRLKTASIQSSAALLPVTTSDIKTGLENDLGLTCQAGLLVGGGIRVAYKGWSCGSGASDQIPTVDIWSRRDEPEKTDLVWAVTVWPIQDQDRALLTSVAALSLSGADAVAAQDWLSATLPSLHQSGDSAETIIGGVSLQLALRSATRLNFFVGDSQ